MDERVSAKRDPRYPRQDPVYHIKVEFPWLLY